MKINRRKAILAGAVGGAAAVASTVGGSAPASAEPKATGRPNQIVPNEAAHVRRLRVHLNRAAAGDPSLDVDEAGRAVVEAEPRTYVLKRTLIIGPNTTLRATGATFVADYPLVEQTYSADRSGWHSPTPSYPDTFESFAVSEVTEPTLLLNHVPDDSTPLYRAPGNIRVEGGIWDPSAHYLRDADGVDLQRATAAPPMDAMTFQHTHDVEVVGATIRNVKWWHAVEFNAVKTATIADCRLEGWIENPTTGLWNGEAVQVDMPWESNAWAGAGDTTPARDVRVIDNYCGPSDSQPGWAKFAGAHTSAPGKVFTDIWIERNVVENSKWDAILPMNASRIVIRENTITDCRGGIYVKAINPNALETVDIVGNEISLIEDTDRPVIGVVGNSAQVNVEDVAVYGNSMSGGSFWYSWVKFRREPQR